MPFAKVCVDYVVGDELPNKIESMELDPVTEEKRVVEITVSYPVKPRFCSSCRALGHIVGACPTTRRQWVPKISKPINSDAKLAADEVKTDDFHAKVPDVTTVKQNEPPSTNDEGVWQTVQRRKAVISSPAPVDHDSLTDASPSPQNTFKHLSHVDEIEVKRAAVNTLSKSQKKKQRKALGNSPQPPS